MEAEEEEARGASYLAAAARARVVASSWPPSKSVGDFRSRFHAANKFARPSLVWKMSSMFVRAWARARAPVEHGSRFRTWLFGTTRRRPKTFNRWCLSFLNLISYSRERAPTPMVMALKASISGFSIITGDRVCHVFNPTSYSCALTYRDDLQPGYFTIARARVCVLNFLKDFEIGSFEYHLHTHVTRIIREIYLDGATKYINILYWKTTRRLYIYWWKIIKNISTQMLYYKYIFIPSLQNIFPRRKLVE